MVTEFTIAIIFVWLIIAMTGGMDILFGCHDNAYGSVEEENERQLRFLKESKKRELEMIEESKRRCGG